MVITPAQAVHIVVEPMQSAGLLLIFVIGAGGVHGVPVTGMHGAGVGTTFAMPAGFVGAMHVGNGQ